MTAETFHQIEKLGAVVDLSARAKFALKGADRVRYLNGQVTNDVRKASATSALYACVTNLKGKIQSDIYIHSEGGAKEALYLDAPADQRESLSMRLEKYIIADDVELSDVTEAWSLYHVFGSAAESPQVSAISQPATTEVRRLQCNRFGISGFDIWVKGESLEAGALGGVQLSQEDAEIWRICQGIPTWPNELNDTAFPQEAGLESKVMDFSKGCYIGQEILSRIKMTGKMPRTLVKWSQSEPMAKNSGVAPGMSLFTCLDGEEMREAGVITSACVHPALDRWVGLAYVRQGIQSMHSLLLADEEPPRIFAKLEFTLP